MGTKEEELRTELVRTLLATRWPDRSFDGMPTKKIADMLADDLISLFRRTAEQAWDEAMYHVDAVLGSATRRAAMSDNPYRVSVEGNE